LQAQGLELEVSSDVRTRLAIEGYDPTYGARPLKRVIQWSLENPLATELLRGHYEAGDEVGVELEHGDIVFRKRETVPG
jgi:ATP-dependent Clp protease ATP-binding subunit ClpA